MKNILLCSPRFGNGGIGRWTNNILETFNECPNSNYNVIWYYTGEKGLCTTEDTPLVRRLYNAWINYYSFLRNLGRVIDNSDSSVIHLSTSASFGLIRDLIAIQIIHKKNKKAVVHYHFGRIPNLISKNNWEGKLLRKIISKADMNIVMDKSSYKSLIDNQYKNVSYLPNPLSTTVNQLINKTTTAARIPGLIVFAGQMLKTKGIYELISACTNIKGIKLRMLGLCSPETKQALLELASSKNEDWLEILGNQPLERVIKEMMTCNVFVLPTYTEGFPNVIIESMACGCPIITTPVGAIPEMLAIDTDSPCGLIVKPKQTIELRNAIERVLSDSNLADTLSRRAKTKVRRDYSIDSIRKGLIDIWEKTDEKND